MRENPGTFPSVLESIVRVLRDRGPIPLRPREVWNPEMTREIQALTPTALEVFDNEFYHCLRSALHLWNDDLDSAHTIAQSVHTPTGSYCHGIMHRREGDYGNSRYWFRHVGSHPAFPALLEAAKEAAGEHPGEPFATVLNGSEEWDPFVFVDACGEQKENSLLREIQTREIDQLIRFCYRRARG